MNRRDPNIRILSADESSGVSTFTTTRSKTIIIETSISPISINIRFVKIVSFATFTV